MEQPSGGHCSTSLTTAGTSTICSGQPSSSDDGILAGLGGGLCGTSASQHQLLGVGITQVGQDNKKTLLLTQRAATAAAAAVAVVTATSTVKTAKTSSAAPSPVTSPQGKIFGRNNNGNMVVTSTPSNEAELQLYRVLQRASLLAYYDTLLEMGGDDVQQLCDAAEDEFLEIMALVGMASKPLHVRRLQKALHEWVTNPSAFQSPLANTEAPNVPYSPEPGSLARGNVTALSGMQSYVPSPSSSTNTSTISNIASSGLSGLGNQWSGNLQLTPTLTDNQVSRIVSAAERLSRTLPQLEPRPQTSKKRSSRELDLVVAMSESDPRRMDEIRKYSAIYGRFDCKRKPEKPLTLHEVCVNEAAAQICKYIPALLTRRDELFPLARQVVRDAGFGHSASIRLASLSSHSQNIRHDEMDQQSKRSRLSSDTSSDLGKDHFEDSNRDSVMSVYQKLEKPFDLSDTGKYSYTRSEFDDNDSRFSFSNSSSSPLQTNNGLERDFVEAEFNEMSRDENMPSAALTAAAKFLDPLGAAIHVLSTSGGNIIAVANPALALSPALVESLAVKREVVSPELE